MNIDVTGIIVIVCAFGLPAVIVIAAIIGKFLEEKKRYDSVVKALELGKSPEEVKSLFQVELKKKAHNSIGFARGGIVVLGIGAGLAAMALIINDVELYGSALLIAIIGLALILVYVLTGKKEKTE